MDRFDVIVVGGGHAGCEAAAAAGRRGAPTLLVSHNPATIGEMSFHLTTGTFLRGFIHIGKETIPAGRVGEARALGLSATLDRLGFALGRLKTGTPPRLDGRTIDWAALERQPGDCPPEPMSYLTARIE